MNCTPAHAKRGGGGAARSHNTTRLPSFLPTPSFPPCLLLPRQQTHLVCIVTSICRIDSVAAKTLPPVGAPTNLCLGLYGTVLRPKPAFADGLVRFAPPERTSRRTRASRNKPITDHMRLGTSSQRQRAPPLAFCRHITPRATGWLLVVERPSSFSFFSPPSLPNDPRQRKTKSARAYELLVATANSGFTRTNTCEPDRGMMGYVERNASQECAGRCAR
jgi:hypothetical protein